MIEPWTAELEAAMQAWLNDTVWCIRNANMLRPPPVEVHRHADGGWSYFNVGPPVAQETPP